MKNLFKSKLFLIFVLLVIAYLILLVYTTNKALQYDTIAKSCVDGNLDSCTIIYEHGGLSKLSEVTEK